MLTLLFRVCLAICLITCLQAASHLPLAIQSVTDCHNMTKPRGLPDELWLQLKPKLCLGKGKVKLHDAPELCKELTGNQQYHPTCQVWKRKQASNVTSSALHQPMDRQLLLDCFLQHKYALNITSICQAVVSSSGAAHDSLAYVQQLSKYLSQIDQCLEIEEQMAHALPPNCTFLDAHELVEHCFLYHQFDRYGPCENISWPQVALPTDVRSMFVYTVWKNISFDFEEQLEEYRMGMEGIPDPMAVVMFCLHNSTWTGDSTHHCNTVTKPVKNVTYTRMDRLYQKMYNQKRRDELRYDCFTFHKDENLASCKYITWR